MSAAWKRVDLGGAGLQRANLALAGRLKRRGRAWALPAGAPAQLAGSKDPNLFWKDPGEGFQPPPDKEPEIVLAEKVRADATISKAKVDAGTELLKADKDAEVEKQKAVIQAETQLAIARMRAEMEGQNARMAFEKTAGMSPERKREQVEREKMEAEERSMAQSARDAQSRTEQLAPVMNAIYPWRSNWRPTVAAVSRSCAILMGG